MIITNEQKTWKTKLTTIHITRDSKIRNGISGLKMTETGRTVIDNYNSAGYISKCFTNNDHPYKYFSPSIIYSISLIDEAILYIFNSFIEEHKNPIAKEFFDHIKNTKGEIVLSEFIMEHFKTFGLERPGILNSDLLLKDLITLGISYNNKAYIPFRDIFFSKDNDHNDLMFLFFSEIESFFDRFPGPGPEQINIIKFLRTPSEISPDSIMGQLKFIAENWGPLLGDLQIKLLTGLDHLHEERKIRSPGRGPVSPFTFNMDNKEDPDNFSRDENWMASLVLLAKSTYVWLDQLSEQYGTKITKLDQIPDKELDRIAANGFTGLWLIGIWERSTASAEIKKMTGNPEALSSAYAINDYNISEDIGGEKAFTTFKRKAQERGIRLAGDMVPNHMGIDSKWVIENPDWFISVEKSPFESYTFNGTDLSSDNRCSIKLEDHYYDQTDAAVVFEFTENSGGKKKYIYHGNDGTSMPWNDTAQLNYLNSEVREHVIETIIGIARKFKIIRFDAAMVLTRKHFQRLWYPEPGSGGDIPSRAGKGLSRERFNELFPKEFWLEVVERIAAETPDTLLLAEAFWLMEPYFVRTLGMHRVYNSSFMNFLRTEDNSNFRTSIKNTIEFNPEILKRFANFMNNPDEETAISQFGSDDKYFGVCTLLSTLPGLPMFGHGQIEGLSEKYGMEYKEAYIDEKPDLSLIARHEMEIFPLLRQREIFSGSENFRLYDFTGNNGEINENVIVYSNSNHGKHSIVIFNNKYSDCSGKIYLSSPYAIISTEGEKTVAKEKISDALGLSPSPNEFVIFLDNSTSKFHIRKSSEVIENGFYFDLSAFEYHTFLEFSIINDTDDRKYSRLMEYLGLEGTYNIEKLYEQEINNPISVPLRDIFHHFDLFLLKDIEELDTDNLLSLCDKLFINMSDENHKQNATEYRSGIISGIKGIKNLLEEILSRKENNDIKEIFRDMNNRKYLFSVLIPSVILSNLSKHTINDPNDNGYMNLSRSYFWDIIGDIYSGSGLSDPNPSVLIKMIKLTVKFSELFINIISGDVSTTYLDKFFVEDDLRSLINVNDFDGKIWYHSENFRILSLFLLMTAYIDLYKNNDPENSINKIAFEKIKRLYQVFIDADTKSENLYENLKKKLYSDLGKI